jgi:anti-sigma factor RsiW
MAIAASLLLVGSLSWNVIQMRPGATGELADVVLTDHIRSLIGPHLVDVPSSDQHTVKPWFDGKLAFVPPVKDFSDEGFPLIGARLDVLNGQTVAALVYGRRKHVINVFVLPTREPDTPIHPPGLRQGYQWFHWRHQGMEYCAVSDLSASELHELAQLIYQ